MNSLNENLHSNIVSSLSDQELEMQQAEATLNASKFTLYYAQGATITAAQKLDLCNKQYKHQQKTYKEAVVDSDFSTNVLSSANSSKAFVDQSVSNTAVAAANVQIAANAISKLAGDIGNAFNIVDAGDYGTEIYAQAKYANDVISKTAYNAEVASKTGMNTSSDIAEVPADSLATKAQNTDTSMKDLLAAVDADFQATSAEMEADNQELAAANTQEKADEGMVEQNNENYAAVTEAYDLSNAELNLNLQVTIPKPTENTGEFIVSFNAYESPFPKPIEPTPPGSLPPIVESRSAYPVDEYYIMVTKYDKSSIFSMANAEAWTQKSQTVAIPIGVDLEELKYRYIKVSPSDRILNLLPEKLNAGSLEPYSAIGNDYMKSLYMGEMLDTDGDPLERGTNYVVFVLATLTKDYKKLINNYDDYLTAPTQSFDLTFYLPEVNYKTLHVLSPEEVNKAIDLVELLESTEIDLKVQASIDINAKDKIVIKNGKISFEASLDVDVNVEVDASIVVNPMKEEKGISKQLVIFATPISEEEDPKKEYRGLFLPNDPDIIKNLLTVDELNEILKITQDKDRVVIALSKRILEILEQIESDEKTIGLAEAEFVEIEAQIASGKRVKKEVLKRFEEIPGEIEKLREAIKIALAEREIEEGKLIELIAKSINEQNEVPKFFFDLTIAEKVPFGSYMPVPPENKFTLFGYDIWYFMIEAETTDNFGNRLIPNEKYLPTILTVADVDYSESKEYTSAYSKISESNEFTYKTYPKN